MQVLVLDDDDVRRALPADGCERAMAAVLAAHARGEAYVPLRSVMVPPGASGFMGLMPAYAAGDEPGGSFAVKSICLMPGNAARGLDMHQGTVTLFSGETGMPVAILNASAVTEIRTAAVTAAATRALAAADARVLAVLGTGVQGRAHLRALQGVRDWEQVRIYSPSAAHAQTAADGVRGRGNAAVAVAASPREAVQGADVVVTVTSSRRPVLERGWLSPGAHVNAVGASTPAAYEIDVATVAAAALFCDNRESLAHEAGEFRQALAEGAIDGPGHVRAELGEVLAGLAPGRSDGELTMFRSLGLGIEDLAAARLALATAREQGIGTEVRL
jgi:ornithine cyclodeaminase/alanine dehydrogenase-like protein (mu-crystallin family)